MSSCHLLLIPLNNPLFLVIPLCHLSDKLNLIQPMVSKYPVCLCVNYSYHVEIGQTTANGPEY